MTTYTPGDSHAIWNFRGHEIKCSKFVGHPNAHNLHDNESEVKERHWHIQPGDVVFDVGAAFGGYTLPALVLGAARVHAWAPEGFADALHHNLDLNGWSDRVRIHADGLWSAPGFVTNLPTGRHMPTYCTPDAEGAFPVRTLDNFIVTVDRADWLKLDVEGAEVEVLKGGLLFLREFRPKILVEIHRFKRQELAEEVYDVLAPLGYRRLADVPYHGTSHSYFERLGEERAARRVTRARAPVVAGSMLALSDVEVVPIPPVVERTDGEILLPWQDMGFGPPRGGTGPTCSECAYSTWIEIGGGYAADVYHPNLDVRPGPNVDIVHDFEQGTLPFHDGHADRIKIIHCLNHLHGVTAEKLLDDCFRVLKPGGSLYIMVTDIEFVAKRIVEDGPRECWLDCLYGSKGDTHDADFHYWGYTPASLRALMKAHGFVRTMHHGAYNGWEF